MAKKIEPVAKALAAAPGLAVPPAKSQTQLKGIRDKIDKLDQQIIKLINERASHAGEIGRLKTESGEDVFSPAREEQVLKQVLDLHQQTGGPLDNTTVRAIFREIMSGSRALQKVLKVAYLGPEFSFSHLAAIERFGQAVDLVGVGSIATVFEEVNRGHCDFGVAPVENSTDGRVADTLDMFISMPHLNICSEVRLQVHHHLMAMCEQQEIRRIYSKPQALSQCRNWISKNVPHAKQVEVSSTATAAELAQREPGAAAVASRQAATRHGLRLLFSDIEDYPDNETRFAVIGRHNCTRTGHDKTSVFFKVSNTPGALVNALEIFKAAKINLTWIESFPARAGRTEKLEYLFFADIEGHQEDAKVGKALKSLNDTCKEMRILGSYPVSPLPA
ncbi:MAG: prephenate dehydratase [Planctomycetota bacterium]|nr:MAG: prephenate dehydratase [Planctomycetota bacterium]